jgi:hypothetical protein
VNLIDKAIQENEYLANELDLLNKAMDKEAKAKLALELATARETQRIIEERGGIKELGPNETTQQRNLLVAFHETKDSLVSEATRFWLNAANARHIAEARVECQRSTVAIYTAALGNGYCKEG